MEKGISLLIIAANAVGSTDFALAFSIKKKLNQLVGDYKRIAVLIQRKIVGNASPAEIAELKQNRRKIMRAAVLAGVTAAFAAAVSLTAQVVAHSGASLDLPFDREHLSEEEIARRKKDMAQDELDDLVAMFDSSPEDVWNLIKQGADVNKGYQLPLNVAVGELGRASCRERV